MKHIRMTHCLLGLGAAVAILLVFGVEAGTIATVGVALLCPLMMVFCISHLLRHGGSHDAGRDDAEPTTPKAA